MTAGNPGPVLPDRYAQALGGLDPIESMRKAPKRLTKLVRGVSEKRLVARPAEDKWSIKEVIAHLADGEVMLGSRFRMVAAMERPSLTGYDQDAFVERLEISKVRTADLLDDFAAVRKANVRLLERLPREVLTRVGLHSERGEESLADMLVMYAGHDHIHEEQVARLLSARRAKSAKQKAGKKAARRESKADRKKPKRAKRGKKGADKPARAREESAGGAQSGPVSSR